MKPFKFFQKERVFTDWMDMMDDYHLGGIIPSPPNTPRTKECAVIASSVEDFNNWRNELFDRNHVFIITNRDFVHTNGVTGIPTRYTAITNIESCRGLTFDNGIITPRMNDILSSEFHDTINHIRELIQEVHTRIRR